jgi:hypothetical protein
MPQDYKPYKAAKNPVTYLKKSGKAVIRILSSWFIVHVPDDGTEATPIKLSELTQVNIFIESVKIYFTLRKFIFIAKFV